MAGRLWKSVTAFCLGNSVSHGSVGARSDFLSLWQAMLLALGQTCTIAVLGQAQELAFGKHSLLLTLATQQTICPTRTHWERFAR